MSSSASTRWGLASNSARASGMPTARRDLPRGARPEPMPWRCGGWPHRRWVCCGDAHARHGFDVPVGDVHKGTAHKVEPVAQRFGGDPCVVHLVALPELRGSRRGGPPRCRSIQRKRPPVAWARWYEMPCEVWWILARSARYIARSARFVRRTVRSVRPAGRPVGPVSRPHWGGAAVDSADVGANLERPERRSSR